MIKELITCIDSMEGKLCHCTSNKGKGRAEESLGSPLFLDHPMEEDQSDSNAFFSPSLVQQSLPSALSPTPSDLHNTSHFGLSWTMKKIEEGPSEKEEPILVRVHESSVEAVELKALVVVHGQHAIHTLGRPKSAFHPYSFEHRLPGLRGSSCGEEPSSPGSIPAAGHTGDKGSFTCWAHAEYVVGTGNK